MFGLGITFVEGITEEIRKECGCCMGTSLKLVELDEILKTGAILGHTPKLPKIIDRRNVQAEI